MRSHQMSMTSPCNSDLTKTTGLTPCIGPHKPSFTPYPLSIVSLGLSPTSIVLESSTLGCSRQCDRTLTCQAFLPQRLRAFQLQLPTSQTSQTWHILHADAQDCAFHCLATCNVCNRTSQACYSRGILSLPCANLRLRAQVIGALKLARDLRDRIAPWAASRR